MQKIRMQELPLWPVPVQTATRRLHTLPIYPVGTIRGDNQSGPASRGIVRKSVLNSGPRQITCAAVSGSAAPKRSGVFDWLLTWCPPAAPADRFFRPICRCSRTLPQADWCPPQQQLLSLMPLMRSGTVRMPRRVQPLRLISLPLLSVRTRTSSSEQPADGCCWLTRTEPSQRLRSCAAFRECFPAEKRTASII